MRKFRVKKLDKYEHPTRKISGKLHRVYVSHAGRIGTVTYGPDEDGDYHLRFHGDEGWHFHETWLEEVIEPTVADEPDKPKPYYLVVYESGSELGTFTTDDPCRAEEYGKTTGRPFTIYVVSNNVEYAMRWKDTVTMEAGK